MWGFDYFGDSRTVDVHIKRLREKLEGVSNQWTLKTVWGVGYKFELADGAEASNKRLLFQSMASARNLPSHACHLASWPEQSLGPFSFRVARRKEKPTGERRDSSLRSKSLYWHQFLLTAGMVALAMTVLAVSFF